MSTNKREMICIVCPVGCKLHVVEENNNIKVIGNRCPRGGVYGKNEVTNPTRVLPTTVKVINGILPRLPVKTEAEIPKSMLFQAMDEINHISVYAPIKMGDIIIENILDTGVNVVATRDMPSK